MAPSVEVEESQAVKRPLVTSRQVRGFGREAQEMIDITPGLVAYNLGYLALVWGAAVGSIALFWVHTAWYTFAFAFFVVSSRQQALLNCEHEAVHRKFLRSSRWNDFVGFFLCAGPVGSPFGAARARHLAHHRLLSTPEDPDRELHSGEPPKNTPMGLLRYFANGLLGGYAVMVLLGPREGTAGPSSKTARKDLISLALCQAVIAIGLTLSFSWWIYPVLWLLPLGSVTALCHLIRSFTEHAITEEEAPEHSNRLITIHSNWIERGLVSPYNMNYHAEHHLVPSVPAPRLKQLRERLSARPDLPPLLERASYIGALRRYARALRS